jgi:undecaprenyl-diphosphatase
VTSPSPHRRSPRLVAGVLLAALALAWVFTTFVDNPATAQSTGTTSEPAVITAENDPDSVTEAEQQAADAEMTAWKAAVLGVVEGVTEYLPISSTGHLVVTQRILGIGDDDATKDAADSYAIAIQFGAILAVLGLYWTRIKSMLLGLIGRDHEGRSLLTALVLAFLPAVVIGLLFEAPIKDNLLGPGPVIVAWLVGGVALLWLAPRILPDRPGVAVTAIGPRQALIIGCAQVVAMWPGTSRSLVTLLAAFAIGATLAAAVEFSFLLGLMTLGAATLYETAKNGSTVIDAYGWVDPLVGLVFAFVSAVVAVKWMVSYLRTRSLAVFGWERIAAAGITIALLATSII